MKHHEAPTRRVNAGTKEVVWVARYTRPDGTRTIWKPDWNRGKGTFPKKYLAQRAIDEAYVWHATHGSGRPETLGDYFETWTQRHPRSERTNDTNEHRIGRVLDVKLAGRQLKDWTFSRLRRKHALELVGHLLTVDGRSAQGARNILKSLSSLAEDAITDEIAELNFVQGVKVRENDPRCTKPKKARVVLSFDQMHEFARAAGPYEAMVRCFSDTGMRLGEVLPLRRRDFDGAVFTVVLNAHEGKVTEVHGETKQHGRLVPVPPSLEALIRAMPPRIDTDLLFPTPTGLLWRERNFYRDVWNPARDATGMTCTPHDFRHSYVSHLRAAGVDDADLAAIAGHSVETMLGHYTHPLNKSFERVRGLVG